ncbi:tyrosine-type recombinase/integrase [Membranicola marinus]|uniref:Tyrosine-type recombinase/integrase n=1 Tax=Membranihabitans marinus TaxID=1227546 RepID=A0A953HSG8_9BACT|nr:tyrosine-type recombinase/integrase [Membranihabitans marinus]
MPTSPDHTVASITYNLLTHFGKSVWFHVCYCHGLLEGNRKAKYSNRSAAQVLKRAIEKAGIKKSVTLHTLRHSFATHLINKGVNNQYFQEILSHNLSKTIPRTGKICGKYEVP